MRILALDQSSIITGYAVFDDSQLKDYGYFEAKGKDLNNRLNQLRQWTKQFIVDNQIEKVILEDIQEQTSIPTFKILSEVYGVLSELVTELNLPLEYMFSSSWKSQLKIKGKSRPEQKAGAAAYVKEIYSITPIQDACDAICIGTAYLLKQSTEINWD